MTVIEARPAAGEVVVAHLPYEAFKFEFVARWPESWTIRRSEILAWLATTQETS